MRRTPINKKNKKVRANSGEKVKRPRKRGRKNKMAGMGSETLATKAEDKPGPSEKKKASKRAESMGMIFMCSSKTKKDCYRYNVLGLPASKRDIVQKIYKGMRLFLYDFDLKLMYGIYKAAGPGGFNIEPKAFKSAFPSQASTRPNELSLCNRFSCSSVIVHAFRPFPGNQVCKSVTYQT